MRAAVSLTLFASALFALTLMFSGLGGANAAPTSATKTVDVGDNWFCDASFQNGVCQTSVAVGRHGDVEFRRG